MNEPVITPADIKAADISDGFKKCLLEAYEDAQEEDDAYFFEPARRVFAYLIGKTDSPPSVMHGINFDDIVDENAPWGPLDGRIIDVLIAEENAAPEYISLFSWLWERLQDLKEEPAYADTRDRMIAAGAAGDDREFMNLVMRRRAELLMSSGEAVTSFGRAALEHDLDSLWQAAAQSDSHAPQHLSCLFALWEKAKPDELEPRADELLEKIEHSGTNGPGYAIDATKRNRPRKAVEIAERAGPEQLKLTLYAIYFYRKKKGSDDFKKEWMDACSKYGVSCDDIERLDDLLGEEALPLYENLNEEYFSSLFGMVEKLDTLYGERALGAFLAAFSYDWGRFNGAGQLRSHRAYLEKVFGILGKYDFSSGLPRIWSSFLEYEKNDRKTLASLLASVPNVSRSFIESRLEGGSQESQALARTIWKKVKGSGTKKATAKKTATKKTATKKAAAKKTAPTAKPATKKKPAVKKKAATKKPATKKSKK